ncbi:class I SAM-dependent methyltransferase [Amycolatopsis acididurans]|uniref:class I SAM-dependent methyltransferase n=1 Tax=Amycolatopsis acididurans TaxID=2724524 RepID=UPI0028A73B75|nr:methyltransferase domain-containing protein [Amycolatopsis acididurans]
MRIPDGLLTRLAVQLGRPHGVAGRAVGRMLNRGNRAVITAAVAAATDGAGGGAFADIGFGGGAGLALLLERAGREGRVVGVEIARTMLDAARSRFRADIAAGRLELHEAPMDALPLPDDSLDALISTNTIYFIEDLAPAFGQLVRVVRPSGRVVLGVGDPVAMAKMPVTRHRFRLRPMAEVIAALDEAGLSLLEDRRVGNRDAFHLLICRRRA